MHEVTVNSTPNRLPVVLGAAFMKLMRIIPDKMPGYPDAPITVKRYLLTGAGSVFSAVVSGATSSLPPQPVRPRRERESAWDRYGKTLIGESPAATSPRCPPEK
jgi:hypothetical protein